MKKEPLFAKAAAILLGFVIGYYLADVVFRFLR